MDSIRRKPSRQGSSMSDRQVGRAAYEKRRMVFHLGPVWTITGYVVGSDDFHWLVVSATHSDRDVLRLVHKTCPQVEFEQVTLDIEPESTQAMVQEIGNGFWDYCARTYLGRTATTEQEQK